MLKHLLQIVSSHEKKKKTPQDFILLKNLQFYFKNRGEEVGQNLSPAWLLSITTMRC